MISGQKVSDKDDKLLTKLKILERLTANFTPPPLGLELEIFPWLKYFGHPIAKQVQVIFIYILYRSQYNYLYNFRLTKILYYIITL